MRPFIQYLFTNEYAIVSIFLFAFVGVLTTIKSLIRILSRLILHRDIEFKYTWR